MELEARIATLRMADMLMRKHPAPVRYEDCKTPVQVIASELNRIWPLEMVSANFERLGCEKQLVRLDGAVTPAQDMCPRQATNAREEGPLDWG